MGQHKRLYCQEFLSEIDNFGSSIENMWLSFKTNCHKIIDNVPSKLTSTRFNQPWINTRIKQLAKKKQRQYNRANQPGKEKDWSHFKALKKQQNKECGKAHNIYVASIDAPELQSKPRKFWSYLKSKKWKSCGVSPWEQMMASHTLITNPKLIFSINSLSLFSKMKRTQYFLT